MATANTQADEHQPSEEKPSSSATSSHDSNPPHEGRGPIHNLPEGKGTETVSIIAAALSAVGLLTIILGADLTPSNAAILAGTVVMTLACLLWITASLTALLGVLRQLPTLRSAPQRAAGQRKPE